MRKRIPIECKIDKKDIKIFLKTYYSLYRCSKLKIFKSNFENFQDTRQNNFFNSGTGGAIN